MASDDCTHFIAAGARAMAQLVAEEVCKEAPDMIRYNMEC